MADPLDLAKKLMALALNNPNEQEARSAALKAVQVIHEHKLLDRPAAIHEFSLGDLFRNAQPYQPPPYQPSPSNYAGNYDPYWNQVFARAQEDLLRAHEKAKADAAKVKDGMRQERETNEPTT